MNIAENIRKYREQAGMLQSDLGRHLGVSAQAVSKWELGKAEPDCTCILKMCSLFGVSADDLRRFEPYLGSHRKPLIYQGFFVLPSSDQV